MSEQQAWFLMQSHSFQTGFQDYREGQPFVSDKNSEWQRGHKWAKLNNVVKCS
jgi:hypothetical protein